MICDKCGADIQIGDYPFCGGKNAHGRYSGGAHQDTLEGGAQWIENLDTTPVWVETKTQLHREAAKRGLRWTPNPQPKGTKPLNPDNDVRGRFNGGALPTYREHYNPAPAPAPGDTGER